jgi:hypothetical protein
LTVVIIMCFTENVACEWVASISQLIMYLLVAIFLFYTAK